MRRVYVAQVSVRLIVCCRRVNRRRLRSPLSTRAGMARFLPRKNSEASSDSRCRRIQRRAWSKDNRHRDSAIRPRRGPTFDAPVPWCVCCIVDKSTFATGSALAPVMVRCNGSACNSSSASRMPGSVISVSATRGSARYFKAAWERGHSFPPRPATRYVAGVDPGVTGRCRQRERQAANPVPARDGPAAANKRNGRNCPVLIPFRVSLDIHDVLG